MYHKHQYQLQTKNGEVKYFICVEHRRKNIEDSIIYFDENQKIVSTVFISISLICLFLHIVIYSTLKKLRQSLQSKNLLSLVCSMFFGQSLFLFGFDFTRSKTICVFISVASHYFLLVSFFCMNVISFDVCHTFINVLPVNSIKKRFKIYLYYSWALQSCCEPSVWRTLESLFFHLHQDLLQQSWISLQLQSEVLQD